MNAEAYAMPGTSGAGAVVTFWLNVGMDVPFDGAVSEGTVSSSRIFADENEALSIFLFLPWWRSGGPGSRVALALFQFPQGQQTTVTGYSEDPESSSVQSYGTYESEGDEVELIGLSIPKTATPGYSYYFSLRNAEGRLILETSFEVATLKASRTMIRRGGSVRLSGIVPTEGHWGDEVGKSKAVTVYQRWKPPSASIASDPYSKGWSKIGTFRANGHGRFLTRYLRPSKSTWYVVKWAGDDWYRSAYTDPVKVTVK